jgi:hypothetical protein
MIPFYAAEGIIKNIAANRNASILEVIFMMTVSKCLFTGLPAILVFDASVTDILYFVLQNIP